MSSQHLTDPELDALLTGEDLTAGRAEHVQGCVVCRRRRDGFLAAIEAAAGDDPDEDTRSRVRQVALARWGRRGVRARGWWLAAAAAVLVAVIVPLSRNELPRRATIDPDVVLQEVEEVLARDPLAVMASEDVVEAVVPDAAPSSTGGSPS